MLGVVIVMLAMVGAVFGTYLAGVDAEQYEVTKYDFMADISGLFDYDQSPQYIDYDPSSNYVGYYSQDSYVPAMERYYFAEDDVSYTPNTDGNGNVRPNNYKVQLAPTVNPATTSDLSSLTLTNGKSTKIIYKADYEVSGGKTWEGNAYSLKEIIDALNIPSTSTIRINLENVSWPNPSLTGVSINTVLFVPISWYAGSSHQLDTAYILKPGLDVAQTTGFNNSVTSIHNPYQSLIIDVENKRVQGYFGTDYTDADTQSYTLENTYVCFGNTSGIHLVDYLNLDTDMPYQVTVNQPASYLNPNYGVALKEANE